MVVKLGLDVNQITLHLHAALTEKERKLIGERTSATLQRKIASGWPARNPDLSRRRWKLCKTNAAKADEYAKAGLLTIRHMVNEGMVAWLSLTN